MLETLFTRISWLALTMAAIIGFCDSFSLVFGVNPRSGWEWLVLAGSMLVVWSFYATTIRPLVRQVWCPGCGNKHEPPLCESDDL